MVEKNNSYLVLMRQSSDELVRRRFFRRCDIKYWYVASALAICQLTTLVCYLEPSWLVVKIGRYTLLLGVWGYCLNIESFEDCVYLYKPGPWDAQMIVLRLFQLMETLLLVLNLVSLITVVSCKRRCQSAKCRSTNYFPLILDLLLVSSGVAAFGGVLAFYMTFITYSTTDDEIVLTLLNDRRPGWAIIVSIIAYCFMILFSVILISCRSQTSDLGVNDNELIPWDGGVRAEGAYEIADDAVMPGVKQVEDISIETYENASTEAESDEKTFAGKDEPGESKKEMWEEASRRKEELEKELKEKTAEQLCRQQEENLRRQRQQEETKTSELIYCLSEVDVKSQELEEKDDMLQIQTTDEDAASTQTLRGDEDEREEETKPSEDTQEEVAKRQSQGEETKPCEDRQEEVTRSQSQGEETKPCEDRQGEVARRQSQGEETKPCEDRQEEVTRRQSQGEETKPCEDRQGKVARRQSKGEEKSNTDIADDRLNAKVLIPECPSMDGLKKKKKKKMKLCCNS